MKTTGKQRAVNSLPVIRLRKSRLSFIIQHVDTLPKYGKKSMYVGPRNVYPTIYVSYTCKLFLKKIKTYRRYFLFKLCFVINVLNYKTIITLKLA